VRRHRPNNVDVEVRHHHEFPLLCARSTAPREGRTVSNIPAPQPPLITDGQGADLTLASQPSPSPSFTAPVQLPTQP